MVPISISAFWSRELRLSLEPALSGIPESSLVGVIYMSQRRDPQRILHGEPESPVSPQSTFPAQEITVRERPDEGPLPDWKLAHGVKKSESGNLRGTKPISG